MVPIIDSVLCLLKSSSWSHQLVGLLNSKELITYLCECYHVRKRHTHEQSLSNHGNSKITNIYTIWYLFPHACFVQREFCIIWYLLPHAYFVQREFCMLKKDLNLPQPLMFAWRSYQVFNCTCKSYIWLTAHTLWLLIIFLCVLNFNLLRVKL